MPDDVKFTDSIAIDTEAMGLKNTRDRLCVVQLSAGDGDAHIVHFPEAKYDSPNLKSLLQNNDINKIFHFARFDVAIMQYYFNIKISNIYCTKIASKLARTYTSFHGLKDLCNELLKVNISKNQQCSNWGRAELTEMQVNYAAQDVLHLHKLKQHINELLKQESRFDLAQACFDFIPTRVELDLSGWEEDIFQH